MVCKICKICKSGKMVDNAKGYVCIKQFSLIELWLRYTVCLDVQRM